MNAPRCPAPTSPARRYRITIAYDGTRFVGWQRQPVGRSVQGVIEKALEPLAAPGRCVVHGSGRTDAGVHARGQIAHFDMHRDIGPVPLRRALNGVLPTDVQVLEADQAAPSFDARRSAIGKEYRYAFWNAEVLPPDQRLYATHVRAPMDLTALRTASRRFIGRHDFAAFSANPHRDIESTEREIFTLDVLRDGPRIELRVTGEGFLYKMVRSIAGFMAAVGTGKETPDAVTEILRSGVRTARVETAPPQGLFLWRVMYPGEDASPAPMRSGVV